MAKNYWDNDLQIIRIKRFYDYFVETTICQRKLITFIGYIMKIVNLI